MIHGLNRLRPAMVDVQGGGQVCLNCIEKERSTFIFQSGTDANWKKSTVFNTASKSL